MSRYPAYPRRLVEIPPGQDPVGVGPLIRSAIAAPDEEVPRVRWRVRSTLQRGLERRGRMLRVALVGILVFLLGGVVGATVQPLWRALGSGSVRSGAGVPTEPRRNAGGRAPPQKTAAARAVGEPAEPTATPSLAPGVPAKAEPGPSGAVQLLAPPARAPAARRLVSQRLAPAPDVSAPQPVSTPLPAASPTEHAMLAAALEKLRTSHEPKAALAALDEYRRRFPAGLLAPEAARLRTEALLLLGQKAAVLEELDRSASSEAPGADERLLLRGELRAATGRWQAALADFDAAWRAHSASDSAGEDQRTRERVGRALWGRASARSHVGDDAGARADLREYLRRFPDGRFAAQANRLLDEHR
jgi:hypothetical protein